MNRIKILKGNKEHIVYGLTEDGQMETQIKDRKKMVR